MRVFTYNFYVRISLQMCSYRARTLFGTKLRDFQETISHFSSTPFSAKKSLESVSLLVLPQHEKLYPEGLFCVCCYSFGILLTLALNRNSRTFQHRLQFSRTFKAIKIQGLSRYTANQDVVYGELACRRLHENPENKSEGLYCSKDIFERVYICTRLVSTQSTFTETNGIMPSLFIFSLI